jgi:uncharacterized protein (TIGR02147 family)
MIERVGKRLALTPEMITQLVDLERTPPEPWTSRELKQLSRDAALTVAEWHHHAILELTHLATFKPDVRWISRVLDVSVDQVNMAITRLARLGLLDMRSRTSWVDAAGDSEARLDGLPARAIGALAALAGRAQKLTGSNGERPAHYSATTVAVTTRTSRRITERVERFRREVAELLEADDGDRDQVYCLELAFFPLANLTTTES